MLRREFLKVLGVLPFSSSFTESCGEKPWWHIYYQDYWFLAQEGTNNVKFCREDEAVSLSVAEFFGSPVSGVWLLWHVPTTDYFVKWEKREGRLYWHGTKTRIDVSENWCCEIGDGIC